jgi:hypothetical protein
VNPPVPDSLLAQRDPLDNREAAIEFIVRGNVY